MYGYVLPHKKSIKQQDYLLYRAFYCSTCVATGKLFGQWARFAVGYDSAFLAALVSDTLDYPQKIIEKNCVGHPFKKTPMFENNDMFERVAAANALLARWKLYDDVTDGSKKARVTLKIFRKAYNKACEILPGADEIIGSGYEKLRECEKAGEKSVDRASDGFATLLKKLFALLTEEKASDEALSLVYNIGKFAYVADALDDVDEDFESGNYNPFLAAYGNYADRRQFIRDNRSELEFTFNSTVNRAIAAFNDMKFTQSRDLLENIIYYGLRAETELLFASDKKLPRPKI